MRRASPGRRVRRASDFERRAGGVVGALGLVVVCGCVAVDVSFVVGVGCVLVAWVNQFESEGDGVSSQLGLA
ncbi:hypothetical protein Dimus_000373, partial [Dionaea muscipula]